MYSDIELQESINNIHRTNIEFLFPVTYSDTNHSKIYSDFLKVLFISFDIDEIENKLLIENIIDNHIVSLPKKYDNYYNYNIYQLHNLYDGKFSITSLFIYLFMKDSKNESKTIFYKRIKRKYRNSYQYINRIKKILFLEYNNDVFNDIKYMYDILDDMIFLNSSF